jgi:hypothetical protein
MSSFLMEHFRASYLPKAHTVHLTLTNGVVMKIDPWMLATISSLFRSIPTPSDDIFEVNQQGLLRNTNDLNMFLTMCGGPDILLIEESCSLFATILREGNDEDEEGDDALENAEALLFASRLCDFLGIEAMSALQNYQYNLVQIYLNPHHSLQVVIMFHQAALVTNNKIAIKNIEDHIHRRWIISRAENTGQGDDSIQMAVYDIYYRVCQQPIELQDCKNFLLSRLEWERHSKHFGFNITISS